MDIAEFNAYREQTRRVRMVVWSLILLSCVGVGLLIGFIWSFAVGIPFAALLALLGYQGFSRFDKARLVKRFPELANPGVRWRKPDFPSD